MKRIRAALLRGVRLSCWLVAALVSQAVSAEQLVIRFSHVVSPDTAKGRAIELFKQIVEERSAHQVKVEIYPNSSLYGDSDELEALRLGAVQLIAPTLGKLGPLGVRQFEVFDLPYLFADMSAVHRVTEGPIGARLFDKLRARGVRGLAYWDGGFKVLTANRALRVPEDARGMKFRIQASKVIDAQFRALGANPEVMPFAQTYAALASGVVDGCENTPANLYTQRIFEVQDYLTVTRHGYIGFAVLANDRFWSALPPATRALLEGALAEAGRYIDATAEQDNQAALAQLRLQPHLKVLEIDEATRLRWRAAFASTYQSVGARIGPALVREAQAAADSAAVGPPQNGARGAD